jgi:hypothetical protein
MRRRHRGRRTRSATTGLAWQRRQPDSAKRTARSTYAATASCSWAGSCATRGRRTATNTGACAGRNASRGPAAATTSCRPSSRPATSGINNGGQKGDEQGILCDASCRAQRLRGFVTETAFDGNLGGLFGADLKCRRRQGGGARRAGALPCVPEHRGHRREGQRFEKVATSWPYVLVTGKKFADSFAALIETGTAR